MPLVLDGTNGVSGVDGTASNPAIEGTDSNTGIFYPAADTVAIATGGSQRAVVDASGRVGIGETSPAVTLHLKAAVCNVRLEDADTSAYANVGVDNSGSMYLQADPSNSQASTAIYFATDGTERARITNSGDFYLGNTAGIVGNEKLSISQPTSAFWAQAIQLGNTANGTLYTNTSGTASYTAVSFRNNGTTFTTVGNITVSGTTVTYGSVSDYRLKENVQPMTNALAKVAELKPCTYTWKSDGSNGEGFIAHELQSVIPSSVAGEKDSVNEDGSINPQMVDTSFIVATLTAAIQELNVKVEAQAAQIAALKGNA